MFLAGLFHVNLLDLGCRKADAVPRQQQHVAQNMTITVANRRNLRPAVDGACRILALPRIVPADGGASLFECVSSSDVPRRCLEDEQIEIGARGLLLLRLLQLSDLSIDSIVGFTSLAPGPEPL